jgi:hypothetical protein
MRTNILLLSACAALLALPSFAQTRSTNPMRGLTPFSGTVDAVDGKDFKITGPGGTTATYRLANSVRIMASRSATMADLSSGKFVGCTAVGTHGTLHATECHIFPPSMRGVGEGHSPMGRPDTTMTNGNITMTNGNVQTATGGGGDVTLRVSYKGGAQSIEVSPRTHITLIRAGNASWLKPGVRVTGAARMEADGTALVQFLNVSP